MSKAVRSAFVAIMLAGCAAGGTSGLSSPTGVSVPRAQIAAHDEFREKSGGGVVESHATLVPIDGSVGVCGYSVMTRGNQVSYNRFVAEMPRIRLWAAGTRILSRASDLPLYRSADLVPENVPCVRTGVAWRDAFDGARPDFRLTCFESDRRDPFPRVPLLRREGRDCPIFEPAIVIPFGTHSRG